MKVVIDIPEEVYNSIKSNEEIINFITKDGGGSMVLHGSLAIINGTPLPKNATNGDVMKEIFPNITMEGIGGDGCISCIAIGIGMGTSYFALDWWNAPYEVESEE